MGSYGILASSLWDRTAIESKEIEDILMIAFAEECAQELNPLPPNLVFCEGKTTAETVRRLQARHSAIASQHYHMALMDKSRLLPTKYLPRIRLQMQEAEIALNNHLSTGDITIPGCLAPCYDLDGVDKTVRALSDRYAELKEEEYALCLTDLENTRGLASDVQCETAAGLSNGPVYQDTVPASAGPVYQTTALPGTSTIYYSVPAPGQPSGVYQYQATPTGSSSGQYQTTSGSNVQYGYS
ncbi:hypothetical protein BG006_004602 [Podila minutissima]|uniref:Uncharacterized protein n=1 Tax=Podila minutissima TaxID=64525 RepID=A0A9P5SL42_9FUNG|nr:hypothetical protein BG006_004602 [Podila minutissima]